ncbi:MAG: peptide/nickel transport system substrate-binding protein [Bacteroidetes bacterium]|nr:MAG: peptide/nickel transport system substrate-binding protein [Bacteroidota bacterium]
MNRIIFPGFIFLLFIAASFTAAAQQSPDKYGGVFHTNLYDDLRSLYPPDIIDHPSLGIGLQVYEGLTRFDPATLNTMPCLAKSWETNDDGTEYTFHLRSTVFFHDDSCFSKKKGKKFTANDVKWCFDHLCQYDTRGQNTNFQLTFKDRVAGAAQYHDATQTGKCPPEGVSGIQVINDSTVHIRLLHPDPSFVSVLSTPGCWIYPKEAYNTYAENLRVHAVGTGPFRLKKITEGKNIILERNPNYWDYDEDGKRLPYLSQVEYSFIFDKDSAFHKFQDGSLDMYPDIPVDLLATLLGSLDTPAGMKMELQAIPSLHVAYYGFQHQAAPFNDVRVRRAFCMAIDRNKITDYILQGDAEPVKGFVPPGIPGYTNSEFTFPYDPDSARRLMIEAGYPSGKNFPEINISINSGGAKSKNTDVAFAIQSMLKENLAVNLNVDIRPFAQHIQQISSGEALFWRSSWIPDYPDASAFLDIFYGKNVPGDPKMPSYANAMRYRSAAFDSLYDAGKQAAYAMTRNEFFRRAEEIMLNDAALCPLYFETDLLLLQKRIRNFKLNPLRYPYLREVWISR